MPQLKYTTNRTKYSKRHTYTTIKHDSRGQALLALEKLCKQWNKQSKQYWTGTVSHNFVVYYTCQYSNGHYQITAFDAFGKIKTGE